MGGGFGILEGMSDFVHLHLHTTYSLLDGQCQIGPLVKKACSLGMTALAVTDHGNLFALKAFYDEARKQGIKPILGCEAYIVDHSYREKSEYVERTGQKERRFHLCLHALNLTGYHNLVRLLSEAHINGFYGRPRIDHELLEKYHEGLHCSSACIAGEIAYYLDDDPEKGGHDDARAEEIARWYQRVFGDDYSLEVMLHKSEKKPYEIRTRAATGNPGDAETVTECILQKAIDEQQQLYARQRRVNDKIFALAGKLGIRVIATNDVHFLEKDEDDSHDVLLAMSTGKTLSDEKRMIYTGQEYFKTEEEMRGLFPDHPEAIAATKEIAERVESYELNSDPIMPKFPIPESFGTEEAYAAKFTEEALRAEFNTPEKPKNFERLGGFEKVLRIKFEADYLESLVYAGMKRRWGEPTPPEIRERVDFELNVIKTMGFPGYFLIVNDYIDNARRMGVWVGPGRGSAAGAAVAYALGITNVDPIKYDLLFERFLNPDRISMPDIDVDFDDAGRGRVLEFVTRKYGQDHVAHIVTFGQLAAKSVIKDVGRVMSYPLSETNKLVALVPDTPKITFKKATSPKDKNGDANSDYSPGLVEAFNSSDDTVRRLMERAKRLEGGLRQPGIHACGVIISRDPLIETLPVMPTEGESLLTTQYDGHFVEPVGLLKMDFLGLKTLTVEKECVSILGPNNPRVPEFLRGADGCLDPDRIPDDDVETYKLFGRGETTGLFQFESAGMKKWLIALQPEKLTDLVAMNALYRPGPMDYIPTFVRRKKGEEPIVYDHPLMEKYLKDTYGVCVYQEQVMLLSRLLGGFTRGMSDKLRKAMGKKQLAVMEELKVKFVDGCLANPEFTKGRAKVGERQLDLAKPDDARVLIDKIWEDWRAFASYAFNKSHAVCYAWVAYQTGYMKAHYPAEFMCAQISSEIGNFDKLPGFVQEAAEIGLDVLPPSVNESRPRFAPDATGKKIRYGLGGVKGVGELAAETIVAEREKHGPYRGLKDLCMRLAGVGAVNKRVLENLVKTGAFDFTGLHRARLFNNIDFAIKRAASKASDEAKGIMDLFAEAAPDAPETDDDLPDCPAWPKSEDYRFEKELLGIYASGHPLGVYESVLRDVSTFRLSDFTVEKVDAMLDRLPPFAIENKRVINVRVAGMLTSCQVKTLHRDGAAGRKFVVMTVDDGSAKCEAVMFAKDFEREDGGHSNRFLETHGSAPVLLCGEIGHKARKVTSVGPDGRETTRWEDVPDQIGFTVREAYPLESATEAFATALCVRLRYDDPQLQEKVSAACALAQAHPGKLPMELVLRYPDDTKVTISTALKVLPNEQLLTEMQRISKGFGYRTVAEIYLHQPTRKFFGKKG